MTTGALQADMTFIMVCVITRQTVQRETIVASEGEAVDDVREMCATACRSLVAQSDQHNSPSEDETNSHEQDETIVRSVPSVLLQGAATKRSSQTMTATVSARGTSLRVLRESLCVGQPSAQQSRGANSAGGRRVVGGDAHRRTWQACSPEPSAASAEPDCVHPAGQGANKMIIKGRNPTKRHVSRTHRVSVYTLIPNINSQTL